MTNIKESECNCKILVDVIILSSLTIFSPSEISVLRSLSPYKLVTQHIIVISGLKYHMQSVHGMSDKSCKCESCQAELNNEEQSVVDKHFKQPHKHRPHKCKLCTSSFTQVCYGTAKEQTIEAKVHLFSRCSLVSIPLKKQRKKKTVPSLLKCVES